jgi:membrane-bound lytic murein transglycosylase B
MQHPDLTSSRRALARPGLLAVGVLAASVALAAGGAAPAGAGATAVPRQVERAVGAPMALPAPGLPGLPEVSQALGAVAVDGPEFRAAADAYAAADSGYAGQRDARTALDRETPMLDAATRRISAEIAVAEARADAANARFRRLDDAIRDLLVELYVSGGSVDALDAALVNRRPSVHPVARRRVLAGASLETLLSERASYADRRSAALAEAEALRGELAIISERRRVIDEVRPIAESGEVSAGADLAGRRVDYEAARVLASVQGADFPLVALDAYHRAAATMALEAPGCGVQWWALAGISRVEGRHGTYGGSSLDRYGNTTRRIIGIPLDGSNDTAVIGDSDGGALDGDPVHDRAVGPMQFIPTTWARFAADGNGDGIADPHNLYDAALAAARYLCRSSGGLAGDGGLRTAYFAYNHSLAYVDNVLGFARGYETAVDIPPVG